MSKLPNGTGEAMSNAVVAEINGWYLVENVKALSFDTTTSSPGIRVLIEQKVEKKALLYLVCRHRIFEVVLGGVLNSLAGPSTGPDILLLKRFQGAWGSMVHDRIAGSSRETNIDRSFNIFTSFVYIQSWFTASHTIQAPHKVLKCFERLELYKSINSAVGLWQ